MRCSLTSVALLTLTVAFSASAAPGCKASAARSAFVGGGAAARVFASSSARSSRAPRTRRPGERRQKWAKECWRSVGAVVVCVGSVGGACQWALFLVPSWPSR